MPLPIINPFSTPYEVWTTRQATTEELRENLERTGRIQTHINDQLIARVSTGLEAANYVGSVGADNGIDCHINQALDLRSEFSAWRSAMPTRTPQALKGYKHRYPHYDRCQVDLELSAHGQTLSPGQELFHAGIWPGGTSFTTDRPLSTSLSPQVALRNAEHRGKAYDAGRIDLFVLRVLTSTTKAFVFKRKGAALGHENEVLFAAGAALTLIRKTLISSAHNVGKAHFPDKCVPLYVLEVGIS